MMKPISIIFTIFALFGVVNANAANSFSLQDTQGVKHQLDTYKGKWVVVNFWAVWCAPCVKEIPDLASFAKSQSGKALVLGIALDWAESGETAEKVKAFAKKVGLTYPLILGNDESEKFFGKVKGMPTTIVYDPEGKEVFRKTGTVTKALLEKIIKGEKV